MAATQCTDRVVGAILASWRYDISGIFPEMRKDYEQHFAECPHCRARQRFHRGLDATLAREQIARIFGKKDAKVISSNVALGASQAEIEEAAALMERPELRGAGWMEKTGRRSDG